MPSSAFQRIKTKWTIIQSIICIKSDPEYLFLLLYFRFLPFRPSLAQKNLVHQLLLVNNTVFFVKKTICITKRCNLPNITLAWKPPPPSEVSFITIFFVLSGLLLKNTYNRIMKYRERTASHLFSAYRKVHSTFDKQRGKIIYLFPAYRLDFNLAHLFSSSRWTTNWNRIRNVIWCPFCLMYVGKNR